MLLRRRNKAETLPCCLCGAHISKEAGVFYSLTFPGRTHKGGADRFWLHLECIEGAMHTSDANLDRDEAYGWAFEDLEEVLQRESWPCCLCGAGIDERGDRVGLRPFAQRGHVYFWTHRRCMKKAMHWRARLGLPMSTKKVKRIAYETRP
jgi:hypothetical protein